jgi:hypothetical protein
MHQRKCRNGKKEVSVVTRPVMKSLLMGIGHYLCRVYNYHNSRAYGYKWSWILLWLDSLDGNGVVLVHVFVKAL